MSENELRERLAALAQAGDAALRERLLAAGWEPVGSSAEALAARVRDETRVFGEIIAARGIRLE